MTEPNILGNVSPAKFIFDSGNTEIINVWKPNVDADTVSAHYPDEGTLAGQDYLVPASRTFYLLEIHFSYTSSDAQPRIQKNTTPDTATGGTTLMRLRVDSSGSFGQFAYTEHCFAKFDAGDYIKLLTVVKTSYDNNTRT